MNDLHNLLYNKKILIYGFGRSGYASYKFLNRDNICRIIDDNKKNIPNSLKKKKINYSELKNNYFDYIVLSPGIDINNCKISNYLNKNKSKIISDLDIFYLSYPKVHKIAITGTNGKSTTSKLLFNVLKSHNLDVRLTGNIGFPILLEKNIKKKTIFIIEASSYQLEYSQFFCSRYSAILNIFPDHIERHGNLKNYIMAKSKLILNQQKGDTAFIDGSNKYLNKILKKNKVKSKIIIVDYKKFLRNTKLVKNEYFSNLSNIKNLSFVFAISKLFKISPREVINVTNKFKGLNFRQQIVYNSKKLKIINDSKSTSLSSTKPLLETFKNIHWVLGGQSKKSDKLNLKKKYFHKIKAYIFGKDIFFFKKVLFNKIKYSTFDNLDNSLKQVFNNVKKNNIQKTIILFSPAAASFDQFKNFEDRGKYFNKILKKYLKNYK